MIPRSWRRRDSWGSAAFTATGETEQLSSERWSSSTPFQPLETPRAGAESGADSAAHSQRSAPKSVEDQQPEELEHRDSKENAALLLQLPVRARTGTNNAGAEQKPRMLSMVMLLALSFFTVGGGPEGGEAVIVAAGPLLGLTALAIFPLVYYVPMAFMVTELVGAIPETGGHAYWVALAFGPGMGLQAGYWAWVGNCMDCAMYSSLAVAALYRALGLSGMAFLRFTARAMLAMVLALPGFFQLRVVGSIAGTIVVFVLVPYALLAVWSATQAQNWAALGDLRYSSRGSSSASLSSTGDEIEVSYGPLLTALVWNFSGFQNLSVFARFVHEPARTFRRVMFISLLLTPLAYLIPILPAIALGEPAWTTWSGECALYSTAKHLGGYPYTIWVTCVGILSASGLYIGGLLCSAYLAWGMAERGFAPRSIRLMALTHPNSHGMDHSVVFCSLAIILVIVNLELEDMIRITNALEGLETMVLIVAALRLRVTRRDLPRPTKLCGRGHPLLMAVALVVPFAASGLVAVYAFTKLIPAALTGVFLFSGVMYGLQTDSSAFRGGYEPARRSESR